MDLSSSPADTTPTGTSGIDAATAELLTSMNTEQAAITVSLGLLVWHAAQVEYILHGIYTHLGNVEKPYTDKPQGNVTGDYIKESLKRLDAIPPEQIPLEDRQALVHDLERCRESFDQRNLFIHGCWTFDDEVQAWRVIKGKKPDRVEHPLVYSEDVLSLATRFARLGAKLTAWDAHFYGTTDPDTGQTWSVKKII